MHMQSLAVPRASIHPFRERLTLVFGGWRLRLLLGFAALAAGVAWQWNWLLAIGVVPFVLSVAPCAAMCALGLCASKLAGDSCKAGSRRTTGTMAQVPAQQESQATTFHK